MEKHGAFIAVKKVDDADTQICTFHDGAEIVGILSSLESVNSQLNALKDRGWVSMGDSDLYVTCHGMGLPQAPFWDRVRSS